MKNPLPYPRITRVAAGDKIVSRSNVLTTRRFVYTVWEPSEPCCKHGTVGTFDVAPSHSHARRDIAAQRDYAWFGRVGTRALPPELDALPYGAERQRRVGEWHQAQHDEAVALIHATFPEAQHATRAVTGELELTV